MDVNTTEIIFRLIAVAEKAIDQGQTFKITVDDITIKTDETVINALEITTEA
jgi:hypothetical protein